MVNGHQHLVIKTWEKMRHEESHLVFNIKTLRIFDCTVQNSKAILTEQVDGNFERHHFYDTSTLKWRECIYYFKRIQRFQDANDDCRAKTQSPVFKSKQTASRGSPSESVDFNTEAENEPVDDFSSGVSVNSHSYLQLYKFNLVTFTTEQMVEGYRLCEYQDDDGM